MDKLSVRDVDVAGKRVFVRVDFNVPLEDGKVTDDSRIRAAIPTIHYLLTHGARVILASHLGRPDGKVQDGLRLRPVAERLSQLLGRNVPVTGDALGIGTVDAVKRLRNGELLLLENLRFHAEEEKNDPGFARQLADYAEIYVNDAFGTAHRAHASTVGVAQLLPAYAGFLMEREIAMLSKLLEDPGRPFAAIVGGAKVSGKLKVLDNLLAKVDVLVLGGGMANTFLLAQGKTVGKSLAEHDMVDEARRVLALAEKKKVRVILPVDVVVAKEVTRGTEYKTIPAEKIPASWHIVDVGTATLEMMGRRSARPGPSSGTGRWACSRSHRSHMERVRSRGQVNRVRVLLKFSGPEIPASGTSLLVDGKEIGHVTRAAYSPALEAPIGMGYLRRENGAGGSEVQLSSGKATVITAPNPHRS